MDTVALDLLIYAKYPFSVNLKLPELLVALRISLYSSNQRVVDIRYVRTYRFRRTQNKQIIAFNSVAENVHDILICRKIGRESSFKVHLYLAKTEAKNFVDLHQFFFDLFHFHFSTTSISLHQNNAFIPNKLQKMFRLSKKRDTQYLLEVTYRQSKLKFLQMCAARYNSIKLMYALFLFNQ